MGRNILIKVSDYQFSPQLSFYTIFKNVFQKEHPKLTQISLSHIFYLISK